MSEEFAVFRNIFVVVFTVVVFVDVCIGEIVAAGIDVFGLVVEMTRFDVGVEVDEFDDVDNVVGNDITVGVIVSDVIEVGINSVVDFAVIVVVAISLDVSRIIVDLGEVVDLDVVEKESSVLFDAGDNVVAIADIVGDFDEDCAVGFNAVVSVEAFVVVITVLVAFDS